MYRDHLLMVSRIGVVAVVRFVCVWWHGVSTPYEIGVTLHNLLETTDAKAIVLNLVGVQDFGAAGMGMLFRFQLKANAQGIALRLSNVASPIKEHIHVDGLDPFFTIVDDEADALAAFAEVDQ